MSLDFDNLEIYTLLLKICKKYSVDPSSSLNAESFFRTLLAEYSGKFDSLEIAQWLEEKVANSFICMKDRPKWIQSSEWPFDNNHPVIFIGQIDVSVDEKPLMQIFHDATSFYLFINNKGETTIITQQY